MKPKYVAALVISCALAAQGHTAPNAPTNDTIDAPPSSPYCSPQPARLDSTGAWCHASQSHRLTKGQKVHGNLSLVVNR